MPFQVNVPSLQLNRLDNLKSPVFKSLVERTYNSENKKYYHRKFALYAKRNSSTNFNPKSYHLIAFELINPLLYIYFPSFECNIFKTSEV